MIKIGSQKIDTNIFLSPLAGCADLAFRLIAREYGAKFCFFEMADANALTHGPGKNKEILMIHPDDTPIAAQLLGGDPQIMLEAAQILLGQIKPAFLDINAACPAKKVLKKRAGAYLVDEPDLLAAIIGKLTSSLPLPITVKLRSGFKQNDHGHIISVARKCEESGAAAIFIHGRTQRQLYAGEVDYEAIRLVKENVSIPIFGSGNILSVQLAKKTFDETGCDGILVARGAIGHPWIFREIEEYLKTGKIPEPIDLPRRIKVLERHLSYIEKIRQSRPSNKIGLMRRIALEYLKGLPNSTAIRRLIAPAKSYEQL